MSKLLDTQSSVMQPVLYLPPEARVSHLKFSEKSDIFSLGVLVVQIITREAPAPSSQQQLAPLSEVDRRYQHIQKIASTHPLRDIVLQCLKDTAMERPTAKKVVTKLHAVKYHPQYEDSLKQEREMAQWEIVQLTEKLKQSQESEGVAQQAIAQLKEKLKSEDLKRKQKSEELHQQLKEKDQKIRDAEIQHQVLKLVLESESERVRDLKKELEETDTETMIAQLKQLQQQLKEKEQEITSIQRLYGKQYQALQALRKELEEKVQDKEKQIQACEIEVKKLLQQSQKNDIKISELEAWKKTIKDKISSLASAAEQ